MQTKWIDRYMEGETDRQKDSQAGRQAGRQTHRHRQTAKVGR